MQTFKCAWRSRSCWEKQIVGNSFYFRVQKIRKQSLVIVQTIWFSISENRGLFLGKNDLVEPPVLSLGWHRRDDDWDRSLLLSVHEDDIAGQAEDEHGEDEKPADN